MYLIGYWKNKLSAKQRYLKSLQSFVSFVSFVWLANFRFAIQSFALVPEGLQNYVLHEVLRTRALNLFYLGCRNLF